MKHWTQRPETPQKRGRKRERDSASRLGGRVIPASGAIPGAGGDFEKSASVPKLSEFLVEYKYTDKLSYRLTRAVLEKIEGEAFRANRLPALMIEFGSGEVYVVLRECDVDWEANNADQ